MDRRGFTERENALIAFADVDDAAAEGVRARSQSAHRACRTAWCSATRRTLSWSGDRSKIFVGLKPQEAQAPRRDSTAVVEPVGNVDVWHWKDPVIQPVQMVRAQQDRNRTFTAAVLLAREEGRAACRRADGSRADHQGRQLGDRPGRQGLRQRLEAALNDIYRVNTATGERTPMLKAQERTLGLSPDGKYFLYWKDKNVWAYDIAANKHVNITAKAPVSFVNVEEDHVGEKPAYGVAGYTKDGKSVILDHRFDEWVVSLDGSGAPRNLTNGVGAKSQMRFRYVRSTRTTTRRRFGGGGGFGGRGGGGGQTIDLSKPIVLSAFGESTRRRASTQLDGDKLTKLVYEDRSFGRPIKAKNADRVLAHARDVRRLPGLLGHGFANSRILNG